MVKDAEKYKLEDQEYKRIVGAFIALEDCLYVLKNKIKEYDVDKILSQETWKILEYAIEDTTKWLLHNKGASVDEIVAKKEYMEFISRLAFQNV